MELHDLFSQMAEGIVDVVKDLEEIKQVEAPEDGASAGIKSLKRPMVKTADKLFRTEAECKEANWESYEKQARYRKTFERLDRVFK